VVDDSMLVGNLRSDGSPVAPPAVYGDSPKGSSTQAPGRPRRFGQPPLPLHELAFQLRHEVRDSPGIDVDLVDGTHVFVVKIREGAVQKWNERHPDRCIKPNDRIAAVNGRSGDAGELVAELRMASEWDLLVHRPVEFECCIQRQVPHDLGARLTYAPGGTSLVLDDWGPGPIEEWNLNPGNAGRRFDAGDRIVEINGVRGEARDILEATEHQGLLAMRVLKYCK